MSNIIDLYLKAQGTSEVPTDLHRWAIISLIAACVRDRVYYRKFRDSKLCPNMYVLLIGPSAIGKGAAITPVNKIAKRKAFQQIGCHRIKASAQGIADMLSTTEKTANGTKEKILKPGEPPIGKLYLIMPELSNSIATGPQAAAFIRFITDLYETSDLDMEEITRTHGFKNLAKPCLNCFMGTTKEWLMGSLDLESILSGFTARTVCIQVDYDPDIRYTRPIYPHNRDELLTQVREQLFALTMLEGPFKMSRQARDIENHWYMTRPAPAVEDPKFPIWKREHDMALKLGMIMSLAGSNYEKKIITSSDFSEGLSLVQDANARIDDLINYASTTADAQVLDRAANIIRSAGTEGIGDGVLLRQLRVRHNDFDNIMSTLFAWGYLESRVVGSTTIYNWHA